MMNVSSDMRNLGQDIISAHHMRTKELDELSREVDNMFKEFGADAKARTDFINNEVKHFVNDLRQAEIEHAKERADFVNDLKHATHELKNEVKEHIHEIRDHIHEIKEHVKEIFEETRAEMAEIKGDMAEAKKAWVSACKKANIGVKSIHPHPKNVQPKMMVKEMETPPKNRPENKAKGGGQTKKTS